jgi:DNA-directed RNA polymerase subunit RPC12/RpoP
MAVTSVITCPECAKKFKGREELQGKRVRCPNCGHGFIVQSLAHDKVDSQEEPEPALAAEPPSPALAAEEPHIKSALDEELEAGSNPYGVTTPDLAPRCPNCANELESADARICLHCGYDTLTRRIGQTKKLLEHTGNERFLWLLPGLLCAFGVFLLFLLQLFYCFALPGIISKDSWANMFNHESMRLWIGLMLLGVMWGLGTFAHKRLIFNPHPPEKSLD